MNGRKSREVRKAANEAADLVGVEAVKALEKIVAYAGRIDVRVQDAEARIKSFARRIDDLEKGDSYLHTKDRIVADLLHGRSFLGRLKWLLLGR